MRISAGTKLNKEKARQNLKVKLKSPLLPVVLLVAAFFFPYLIASQGITGAALALIAMVGIPAVVAIIVYPEFGILCLVIAAYFIMWVIRMGINFPLGTVMDALQVLLIFGFLLKQKFNPDWKIYRNPITVLILIWIIYNLVEFFNPWAESRLAWVYTVRSVAMVMLMYFVFMYQIKTVQFIRLLLKLWLALSLFAALYALKQEYFGFFGFEEAGLQDPLQQALLFIGGHWRKFSIFSDPVTFSYNMVISAFLCIALITGELLLYKKIILGILAALLLFSMLYSGTRGAYVLVPASFAMFGILKFSKNVMIISIIVAFALGVLIFMPTSNPAIARVQSAFKPSNDASYNVRAENQRRLRPYILSHPIGGGLGATGAWGVRFAPYSYLANFPPDSGYVRVAAEMGWVGLLIFCIFIFIVLRQGILNFYAIRDPELKSYCLAMVLMIFALNIGNFPQEALVQFPTNIYFYLIIALINITMRLDIQKRELNAKSAK